MGVSNTLSVPLSKISSSTSVVRRKPLQCLLWTSLFILYVHYITRPPLVDLSPPTPPPSEDIPNKIWQSLLDYTPINSHIDSVQTWITKNQGYQYTLVSSAGANALALKHYSNRKKILHAFLSLQIPELRSHLLRYMLLESEGGFYSDLDTTVLKPVHDWIPARLKSTVRAVVAIEYDGEEGEEISPGVESPRLQFSQRTMAASPGHPLMERVVREMVDALRASAVLDETTVAEVRARDDEMALIGGLAVWTKAVLGTLSEAVGMEVSWWNLTGMKGPRVFGDVMVLPVNAFGSSRLDSAGSAKNALVRYGGKGN